MRFRHGDAEAPLKVVGPAPEGKKGTRVTFLPSPETFKITEFDFEKLEHRYRELAFLNSGVRLFLADARHEERVEHRALSTKAASPRSSNISTAPRRRCSPIRSRSRGQRDDIGIDVALEWNDCYYENVLPLHQQHPAARRRHPPGRVPRGADPHAQQLCRQVGHAEEGEGQPHRRRHARGADRDRLGQAARPQVQLADQGQAGQLRGPPAARKPDGRQDGRMARGKSRPTPARSSRRSSTPPPRAKRRARRARRAASR